MGKKYYVVCHGGRKYRDGRFHYARLIGGSTSYDGEGLEDLSKAKAIHNRCLGGARAPYIIVDEKGSTIVDGDGNELIGVVARYGVPEATAKSYPPAEPTAQSTKKTCAFVKDKPYATIEREIKSMAGRDQEAALLRRVHTIFREYPRCSVSGEPLKPEVRGIKTTGATTMQIGLFVCCYKCN